jgi:NDP-hexose C3-ketoreductase / dTDP-4-oxo-2-deoxy-alpha-D-pentos-2-ene 2,3-reductase
MEYAHLGRTGLRVSRLWLGTLEVLRIQGKIIYVDASNFAGWHLAQAREAARARRFLGLVSEQSIDNLVTRDIEREVLPAAQAYGIGMIAWSPLQRGMLGGILAAEREGGLPGNRVPAESLREHRPRLERYESLCADLGVPPAHVALAWLLARPGVTGAVVGPVTVAQLDDVVRCLDVRLDDTTLTQLDEIFPGHRTAPEDYAW